jgi:hypothetical protein
LDQSHSSSSSTGGSNTIKENSHGGREEEPRVPFMYFFLSFSFSAYHRDVGWSHFSINFFCLVAGDVNDDGRDDIYDRPGHGPVVLFSLSVPSSISDLVLLSRLSASSRVGDRKRDQSQKGHHQSPTKGPPLPPHTHPHTEKSFIDY